MALFHVPVSLVWDCSAGFLRHDAWMPVPPGPPALMPMQPSIEMLITQSWLPGLLFNKHSISKKVVHYNSPISLAGHDCGPMIPDLTPSVPPNLKYPIIWFNSSRKFVFTASMVKHDGKNVACAALWPPLPMMTCGDPISAPTAMLNTNIINSEKVGLSLADFLLGLAAAAVSMLIDYLFHRLGKKDEAFSSVDMLDEYLKEIGKTLTGGMPTKRLDWFKWGANHAAGIVLSMAGTDDEGNFQYQAPNVEFSVGRQKVGYNFAEDKSTYEVDLGVIKTELTGSQEGTQFGGKAFGFGF